MFEEEDEVDTEIELDAMRELYEAQERRSEEIALHIEQKGLNGLLDCTLDVMVTEEFGNGAHLYHNFVCIIAYDVEDGRKLGFGVLHPADDRDKCPLYEPKGFVVPWDFDAAATARQVRQLAHRANTLYRVLGIEVAPPLDCGMPIPDTYNPEEE